MDEINPVLFSTPLLRVLDFLLQNGPDKIGDTEIVQNIQGVKRAAVHQALTRLHQMGIIQRTHKGRRCYNAIDYRHAWLVPFKIASNILSLSPLVDNLKDISTKIILFGSRSKGTNGRESDIDLLVVAQNKDAVRHAVQKTPDADRMQLVAKTPEEMLDLEEKEPVLAGEIRKGVILWER